MELYLNLLKIQSVISCRLNVAKQQLNMICNTINVLLRLNTVSKLRLHMIIVGFDDIQRKNAWPSMYSRTLFTYSLYSYSICLTTIKWYTFSKVHCHDIAAYYQNSKGGWQVFYTWKYRMNVMLLAVQIWQHYPLRENKYWRIFPESKVHGANMGPICGRQGPGGPHVGLMNFASSSSSKFYFQQNTTMEQYQEKENTL